MRAESEGVIKIQFAGFKQVRELFGWQQFHKCNNEKCWSCTKKKKKKESFLLGILSPDTHFRHSFLASEHVHSAAPSLTHLFDILHFESLVHAFTQTHHHTPAHVRVMSHSAASPVISANSLKVMLPHIQCACSLLYQELQPSSVS